MNTEIYKIKDYMNMIYSPSTGIYVLIYIYKIQKYRNKISKIKNQIRPIQTHPKLKKLYLKRCCINIIYFHIFLTFPRSNMQ